ncbi:MAG: hypothetical protein AAF824_03005 [Bacteroidota bacterium]
MIPHSLKPPLISIILIGTGLILHAQPKLSEEALTPDIFSVQIWQEGKMIPEKEMSYLLEKKAFTVVLTWEREKIDGVYAFVDTDPALANRAEAGSIPYQDQLYAITMADREFNTNKVLFLSDSMGVNFFSDPMRGDNNYSRFNKIESTLHTFTGYREVESFQNRHEVFYLSEMSQPVYLFCFATNTFEDQEKSGVHVLKRMGLTIKWQ